MLVVQVHRTSVCKLHRLLRRALVHTVTRHWSDTTARNQTVSTRLAAQELSCWRGVDCPVERGPTCAPAESAGSILISTATHPRTQSTMVACTATRPLTHRPSRTHAHSRLRRLSAQLGSARLGSDGSRSAEPRSRVTRARLWLGCGVSQHGAVGRRGGRLKVHGVLC